MYEKLIKRLREEADCPDNYPEDSDLMCEAADAIEELMRRCEQLQYMPPPAWIPIKSRPMDEEEREEWSAKIGYDIEYEDAKNYTSQLPDDGEEVLTCDRYGNVGLDTFNSDPEYGCYFDDNGDMDGITAWMPKPKPYEPPKEET